MSVVFISHAAEDERLAVRLADGIEAAGYPTWYYERDSLPGPSYLNQIIAALAKTAVVVVLVSPAALASWQVDKEIVQAHERGLPFLPVLYGLAHDQLRAQRPEWALAFGAAVSVPLQGDDVAPLVPRIVAGVCWLTSIGRPTQAADEAATTRTTAFPRPPAAPPLPVAPLPASPSPLIGRQQEVTSLTALLQQAGVRLITLTGPGGVGKTRLALQVAAEVRAHFTDGVAFVPLAPLATPDLVLPTLAQALGIAETADQPLLQHVQAAVQERALLLLLDNFEHLIDAAPVVAALLAACPRLTALVTSRVPLRLRGEHEIAVPPLAVPDRTHLPDLQTLTQYAAVALFLARAQEVKADFTLTEATAPAVAEICARLDGVPLAIELAAARVRLLSPPALLARLSNRFALLVGGPRDLPERQRTLRAAIDWSYGLLAPEEQTLLARLAVFVGGASVEAIAAICDPDGRLDAWGGVESLLEKSLLVRPDPDGEPRVTMLETIHAYARERLEERGEAESLARAHVLYYLALAEEAETYLSGSEQGAWFARLESDHDNLRAALRWTVRQADARVGLRLAAALGRFWEVRGHMSEGRAWLEEMLALDAGRHGASPDTPLDKALRAKVLQKAGTLVWQQGDYERATSLLHESLRLYRALGDKVGATGPLDHLGAIAALQARYEEARAYFTESAAVSREVGDRQNLAHALSNLGNVAFEQGDHDRAIALLEESLTLRRAVGNQQGIAIVLYNLGWIVQQSGDLLHAQQLLEESLTLFRDLAYKNGTAHALGALGQVASGQGNRGRARALLEESLSLFREMQDRRGIASALAGLGTVAVEQGEYRRAEGLYRQSLALSRELADVRNMVLGLDQIAELAATQGQAETAARLLGASHELRLAHRFPLTPAIQPRCDRTAATARQCLEADAYAAAWSAGQALSLDQAVALALGEDNPDGDPVGQ